MVVSKRCKICSVLDTDNVSITGEYYDIQLPEIILKICGVELDPRKASDVLICKLCIIQLVHTDLVIEKLRNAVQRLKKNVKVTKLKTVVNKSFENVELQPEKLNANLSKNSVKETTNNTEKKVGTPKKIVRRKSTCPVENSDTVEENVQNGKALVVDTLVKKAVKRKISHPEENLFHTIDGDKQNGITLSINTPIKKSPTGKRKSISSTTKSVLLTSADINKTSEKRSGESPMDLTVDEHCGNDSNNETCIENFDKKPRNCILCGKMFNSKQNLRDHIEIAHMGERLKSCPHCSSEFRSQQKYESHVFSEKCKGSNHACQALNCNKRFKTMQKMELHMQQKHLAQNDLK